jgi:RNA polymerase sigma factor (sigma-70 family)
MADTNLRAWLTCILRNAHRDRLRRAAYEVLSPLIGEIPGLEPQVPAPDADLPSWRSVGDTDVARALRSLPVRYREAYLLRESGLVYEDIARRLHLSVNTVATRIHRARLWLRRQLTEGRAKMAG